MAPLLTTHDLAVLMRVSPQTIRVWWHGGILPEPIAPTAHSPRWRAEDIERWMDKGGRPAQLKAYKRKKKGGAK